MVVFCLLGAWQPLKIVWKMSHIPIEKKDSEEKNSFNTVSNAPHWENVQSSNLRYFKESLIESPKVFICLTGYSHYIIPNFMWLILDNWRILSILQAKKLPSESVEVLRDTLPPNKKMGEGEN